MSGVPIKRLHDEGGNGSGNHGHSSASKYSHENPGLYAKVSSSAPFEYHGSYDMNQDVRLAKIQRTESRDADRRSPLHSMYRVPPSSSDPHSDHTVSLENRVEQRDPKENIRDLKAESRDKKADSGDMYQVVKGDKDSRFGGRGDDIKETKHDKDTHPEFKNDMKLGKDGYGGSSSHLNWKDSKEQHRGRRYADVSDPWHASRTIVHGSADVGKEVTNSEHRDYIEVGEVAAETKIDLKVEDKFRDKDRKRKEGKHREWGDWEKDKVDRRNNLKLCNTAADNKETLGEERESDRWERERRDILKDKDDSKDKEKDFMKRGLLSGAEKEASNKEKEPMDMASIGTGLDSLTIDQKKQKDLDARKNVDSETREMKKERDQDVEDKPEKSRYHDKESDDGFIDNEGGAEKERDVFNSGVQQRKRILRTRGSPQVANRDLRRPQTNENEGSQGKADVSVFVYKVGECMQELVKLWKDYESSQAYSKSDSSQDGPILEIRIPAEHVTATNRQVRGGQLWGTDIYTVDSDLVAVLMHTGYCRPTASPPHPAIQELHATIRVLPPQNCYISSLRNNVRSRAWGAAIGCSYRVEKCCIVKKGGGTIDLEPNLTQTSSLEPTLAPVAVERTMTTRAAASNALRQQRFVREVTIQFNLCNEPWLKYSISVVADKGLKKPLFASARLKKGEVLYLETHSRRYELCFNGEKMVKAVVSSHAHELETERSQDHNSNHANGEKGVTGGESVVVDIFRWSRCKKPLPQKLMRTIGIPLSLEHVEVLEENLEWEDIQWSQTGVWIAGKEYHLARAHFLSPN